VEVSPQQHERVLNWRWRRVPSWLPVCAVLGFILAMPWPAMAVHLRGEIQRVGYPGSGSGNVAGGDIYRVGRYAPVVVDLNNDDGDQFEGTVEVRQADADGDEVIASQETAVRGSRRLFLYVPTGPLEDRSFNANGASAPFTVRVFDRDGALVNVFDDKNEPVKQLLPPRQMVPAPAGALVILDISQRGVKDRIQQLQRVQELLLLRCGPKDLPDHFAGLEMVDVIVWDAPDPSSLDPMQAEALLEWTLRGGRLILGVGKDWNLLMASKFGPLLPARLSGTKSSGDPAVLKDLRVGSQDDESGKSGKAPSTITYCPVTAANLAADGVSIIPRVAESDRQVWLARRACGRGDITLATAEIQQILPFNAGNDSLLRDSILRLRQVPDPKTETSYMEPRDIFARVGAETAFLTTSGLYFAFAFAFVIGYIVVVTGGSWGWLKRQGTIRHAWVIFAGIAVAASGVSIVAVQLVRTLGQGVHEMTIVDGRAGEFQAVATSYLGYKTASHMLVDLAVPTKWLDPAGSPELRASLRPQASVAEQRSSVFSVPQQYGAVAQLGELRSVPLRATLKQFEASWRGDMTGRLVTSLYRRPSSSGELTASSWVENQLGTDLENCYVFVRLTSGLVNVYQIPALEAGRRVDFGTIAKAMEDEYAKTHDSSTSKLKRQLEGDTGDEKASKYALPILRAMLGQCLDQVAGIRTRRDSDERKQEQFMIGMTTPTCVSPLLLLTFFGDPTIRSLLDNGEELTRSYGDHLEMWQYIDGRNALFVGFSDDPGPLRLCRRKPGSGVDAWRAMKPSRSTVMYRFVVPVQ
jgi:hypothetical protein